jgi:oligopeptide transport system substrate-binding protein
VGNGSEPPSIDPHVLTDSVSAAVALALFEPLVRRNPYTLKEEAGAAQRWEYNEDRTEITFHLNPDAKWSNGDPVTAEDFVWSWRRGLSPELGMQQADLAMYQVRNARALHTGAIDDATRLGVRAVDEHTLHVELEHPDPFALTKFSYIWTAPRIARPSRRTAKPQRATRPGPGREIWWATAPSNWTTGKSSAT